MKIINLGEQNSVLNKFIAQMRDCTVQKDPLRFRTNLERVGQIFAYEISKTLNYKNFEVETPLGIAGVNLPTDKLVIGTILRAGLPLHNGILSFFDEAQNCFVATYRKYGKDNKCTMQVEYSSSPELEGKVLILADAMIATGASLEMAYEHLCQGEEPVHTHIVCPIASVDGVEYLSRKLPHHRVTLWVGAIDQELTNKSYIIPGLGDAGDLAYGSKSL